jgi:hypothetical protein
MLRRRRAVQVPDDLELESGERLLAVAEGPETVVAATSRRLVVSGGPSWPWHAIERASWDGDAETLTVFPTAAGRGPGGRSPSRHVVVLTAPGRLVDVVREQVNASLVIDRHVAVDGRRGVRVTGRRTGNGDLAWHARLDAGLRADDPELKRRIDDAVASVRHEVE